MAGLWQECDKSNISQMTTKCIFLNEDYHILIQISLECVLKDPIDKMSSLVQVMAWHWTDDIPLSEQIITYRKTSSISRIKSPNLNASRLLLQ